MQPSSSSCVTSSSSLKILMLLFAPPFRGSSYAAIAAIAPRRASADIFSIAAHAFLSCAQACPRATSASAHGLGRAHTHEKRARARHGRGGAGQHPDGRRRRRSAHGRTAHTRVPARTWRAPRASCVRRTTGSAAQCPARHARAGTRAPCARPLRYTRRAPPGAAEQLRLAPAQPSIFDAKMFNDTRIMFLIPVQVPAGCAQCGSVRRTINRLSELQAEISGNPTQ